MALNKDIFSDAFEELEENIDKNIEKTKKAQDRVSFEFTEDDLVEPSLTPQEKEKSLAENNKKADENLNAGVNELGESVKEEVRQVGKHEVFDPNVSDKGEALRNALFGDEENIKNCFNIINPKTKGFRSFFVGNEGGYKKLAIENLSKLLVSMKKISSEEPIFLAFNELEKYENDSFLSDRFYIINDLGDAIVNLFNSDVSQQSNAAQARYKRIMDKLLRLPANLYIVLDCDEPDYRGFLMLDARVRYRFSKKCVFQDYDDAKVATDFLRETGAGYSLEDVIEFLYNNKKYFPFKNDELVEFLVSTFYETGSLPEDRYKPFALEEAFKNIIGMDDIKNQVRDLESFLKARKRFDEAGIKQPELRLGMLFTGSSGTGKSLSLSTKVITPNGYVETGKIKPGDILYNRLGEEVTVKAIFPQPVRQLYKVLLDDDSEIIADGEHIWLVQDFLDRKKKHNNSPRKPSFHLLTTNQMYESGLKIDRSDGGFRQLFSIPSAAAVNFPEKDLILDPYLLGVLLVRGTFTARFPTVSLNNKKSLLTILEELQNVYLHKIPVPPSNLGKEHPYYSSNKEKSSKYTLKLLNNEEDVLRDKLVTLNLWKKRQCEFFIPESYLFSSLEQRWLLASALIDFKASIAPRGRLIFFFKKDQNQLIQDTQNLFRSLGAKVTKVLTDKHNSRKFTVSFPFDISDKINNLEKKEKYIFVEPSLDFCRYIVDIKPDKKDKAVCFYVESNNSPIINKNDESRFYELVFSSGETIKLSEYDFIELQDISDRYPTYTCFTKGKFERQQTSNLYQVKELLNFDLTQDKQVFSKKFAIDLSKEENHYLDNPNLLHPYILGALLGDGSLSATTSIANDLKDVQIIDTIRTFLPKDYNVKMVQSKNCPSYNFTISQDSDETKSFGKKFLEPLGLLGKICDSKFIPEEYFNLCVEDRRWLLKGLMDTDGFCSKESNCPDYCTVSPQLANDIQRLVVSLGGAATVSKPRHKFFTDSSGNKKEGKPAYIVSMSFPKEHAITEHKGKIINNVFNLKRKADRFNPIRTTANFNNFLVEIKDLGFSQVDHDIFKPEDHTFLVDNFVVTHNTTMARIVAHLLFELGYIKEDKLIETDTQDFVQGEFTSQKTNKMLRQALGGVLFIDEAYNFGNLGERGMESIAIIVKFMEDYKDDLVVMFAGYQKEINQLLLPLNSGLISRIAYKFNIADYTEEELTAMYKLKLGLLGLQLDDSPKVKKAMEGPLSYAARSAKFSGNGRFISNMVQATMVSHAKYMEQHPDADIHVITAESIPPIEQIMKVMR